MIAPAELLVRDEPVKAALAYLNVSPWSDAPGAQILDLDDVIEGAQLACASADEAMDLALTFIRAGLAGATSKGVALTETDARSIVWMLELVKGRTKIAHDVAVGVALARLEGIR